MAHRHAPAVPRHSRKNRQAVQRLREEIDQESPNSTVRAQQRDPNRDVARGDWDRSSRHFDEGSARGETPGEPPAEPHPGRDDEPD